MSSSGKRSQPSRSPTKKASPPHGSPCSVRLIALNLKPSFLLPLSKTPVGNSAWRNASCSCATNSAKKASTSHSPHNAPPRADTSQHVGANSPASKASTSINSKHAHLKTPNTPAVQPHRATSHRRKLNALFSLPLPTHNRCRCKPSNAHKKAFRSKCGSTVPKTHSSINGGGRLQSTGRNARCPSKHGGAIYKPSPQPKRPQLLSPQAPKEKLPNPCSSDSRTRRSTPSWSMPSSGLTSLITIPKGKRCISAASGDSLSYFANFAMIVALLRSVHSFSTLTFSCG